MADDEQRPEPADVVPLAATLNQMADIESSTRALAQSHHPRTFLLGRFDVDPVMLPQSWLKELWLEVLGGEALSKGSDRS